MIQAVPTLASTTTTTTSTGTAAGADQTKLKSAAQQFEAVFLRQMIGSMRSASLGDGMFDNQATEQFQSMADSKTADSMSTQGVFGIAEMLAKQLAPAVPQAKAAALGVEAAGRAAGVVGDLASRFKL